METAGKPVKKNGCLRIFLWIFLIGLFLCLGLFTYVYFQIFSLSPATPLNQYGCIEALPVENLKIQKLGIAVFSANRKNEVFTTCFTPAEINQMLLLVQTALPLYMHSKGMENFLISARYQNGEFEFCGAFKFRNLKLFDSYINFDIRFVPSVKNSEPSLNLKFLKLGRIECPAYAVQGVIDQSLRDLSRDKQAAEFKDAVKTLKVEDNGDLTLSIDPLMTKAAVSIIMTKYMQTK